MKPKYIITVPHSGTTSLRKMLEARFDERIKWTHCEKIYEVAVPRISVEHDVITTFREPELVAASWSRRQPGGWTARNERRWVANWTRWRMFVERSANVFTMDELTEHENADPFLSHLMPGIPIDLLRYAEECANVLR